jgi:hypothetical protein
MWIMEQKEIIKIYDKMFFQDKTTFDIEDYNYTWLHLFRYIPPNIKSHILDAGCGNGRYMRRIKAFRIY